MRLKKLKMSAFGPYKNEQNIDFTKFYDDGLFLITGATGAGKTTIFDAISFVLYGDVSGQRKQTKTLRSDFSENKDICYVELEFEVKNKTYLIKRIPEQFIEKKRGEGLKQKKHSAELILPNGEIKTNLKEISTILVEDVIGVDKENFNKLLMLPQGKFQKLLTETGEEQVNTFRKIFGTEIFEIIANKLFEEKQDLKREYESKVFENNKKIEGYILEEEKLKDEFSFSEKLEFIKKQNEKDKEELKNLEEKIKFYDLKLKDIEISIENGKTYIKKQKEKEELKEKIEKINLNLVKKEEFEKKKKIYSSLENLNTYYSFWQFEKNKLNKNKKELLALEEKLKQQILKKDIALKEFEKVKDLEKEKLNLKGKESEFLIFLNNFKLAEKILVDVKLKEKELFLLKKEKEKLKRKIELKNLKLKFEEIKKLNEELKNLISIKKKSILLEEKIAKLNEKYLIYCKNFYEQQAFRLAKTLKEGRPCPVCGSLLHPSPKKNSSLEVISEVEIENIREKILEAKERFSFFSAQFKSIFEKLSEEDDMFKNFKNIENFNIFLNINLEKEKKVLKEYENGIKKEGKNFTINLEENYEEEFLEKKVAFEKENLNFIRLKKQIEEILKNIPLKLQKKDALKKYEKELLLKNKQLDEKIDFLKQKKEQEETKFKEISFQLENKSLNFNETKKEEERKKEDFFNRLKDAEIEFFEFLDFFKSFVEIKLFVENYENSLKEIEKLNFNIKAIEKDLSLVKTKNLEDLMKEKEELILNLNKLKEREKLLIKRLAINTNCVLEINSNLKTIDKLEEDFKVAKILSDVAKGNKKRVSFEKYVLTSCLNEVLLYSNEWFKKATSNRYCFYSLDAQDCLNFNVFDFLSGKIRHVSTLSGGETFAASLALCLGLCERVCSMSGGIELDTMLIDEGFGTLDSSYLESVIFCLTNLKKAGRQIGVISHIPELKNRIKSQIIVRKSEIGGSKITLKF